MRIDQAIEQRLAAIEASAWKTGVVTGTSGTKVVVTVDNSSVTIPALGSYTPTVGDVVVIANRPGAMFVLGPIANSSSTPYPLTPVCRVVINVDASLSANTDTYAQNAWGIGEDPDGIATLSAAAGTNSYITIKRNGRYLVSIRGVFRYPASATLHVAFVTRNAATVGSSIVRAEKNTANTGGSDGTIVHGHRGVLLNAGDVLYWGYWTALACTLQATNNNVPTEMSLFWLGTR